jgi:DNA polymerase
MEEGEYGMKIVYWGIDQTKKKWSKQDTYGPKLLENIDQAISRDITMNGLQNLHRAGYGVILHVHDEGVVEVPIGVGSLEEVNSLMCNLPEWAKDLPLKAAGEESFYYKK